MKNKYFNIVIVSILLIAFASCNKENQISKNLWNKGGEWNISSYEVRWNDFEDSGQETVHNYGSFQFDKDNTGSLTVIEDNESYTNSFKYVHTEKTLTLTFNDGTLYPEGYVEEYDLTWEKNKIKLYQYASSTGGWSEETYNLEKK